MLRTGSVDEPERGDELRITMRIGPLGMQHQLSERVEAVADDPRQGGCRIATLG
jgi:hypothetical protein